MIRMIFFDIDGTTYLNSIHDSPETTKYAFKKLKELGIKIAICTSRTEAEMIKLPRHYYELMDAMVCANGAQIYINNKLVKSHFIDDLDILKALEIFSKNKIPYRWTSDTGDNYLSEDLEDIKNIFVRLYNMSPDVKKYNGEKLIHLLYYTHDQNLKDEITITCSNSENLNLGFANELTAKGINKSFSMIECAQMFAINKDEIAAFGDGYNDINMIETAALGIAMGNAKDELKKVADYVTGNIEHDGLYNACQHFDWFQEGLK
ncbi:MAG: HAD family hydrolase [Anaerorhabdus sp.]|uniref:HAD family hydrolase n=1 Tax=Anaerorhabdus sp. TaxID=1872524 RepID=UPI002FC76A24